MNHNYVLVHVHWYHKSRWNKYTYKKAFILLNTSASPQLGNILYVMLEKFTLIYIIFIKRNTNFTIE